jgi:hypothetical protein
MSLKYETQNKIFSLKEHWFVRSFTDFSVCPSDKNSMKMSMGHWWIDRY